ncbi:hypothetical protein ACP70R_002759 [Stipagrostis hirtigluma subsp. patula]
MAGIVVSVYKGVMDSVLVKLNNSIVDSYTSLVGVSTDVQFLRDELPAMSALLEKLEDIDGLDPQVKILRNQAREMSYDIEDYIDEFMNNMGSTDTKAGFISKVSHFLKTLRTRLETAWQIKELKNRLHELGERRKRYKIDDCISSTISMAIDPRLSAFYNEAADLVGIDDPKKEVTAWVMDEVPQLKVISIVGFGGLGKTTLANEIYLDVGGQINCKAFVSVSQKPDVTRLLHKVLSQLGLHHPLSQDCEVKDLIDTIRVYLLDKRYLIVIDDLWHVQAWDRIRYAFPKNDRQSRVIVTTRHEDIAMACSGPHGCIHNMKPLSEQDSRKLFFTRIFGSEDDCPSQFMVVSSDILKKCYGLPLAIITVASILACQPTMLKEQWQSIQNSLATQSPTNSILDDMKYILDLSFRSLPSQLKTCFLYLGTYPEDHEIERNDLVRRWVAEGFICHPVGQDAWDVAESYFNELVNRSMIEPKYRYYYNKTYYKVHDMMLDLIICKCRDNNFVSVVHDPQATAELQDKVRRLTMHSGAEDDTMDVIISRKLAQVRSLAIFEANSMPIFSNLKCLRVIFLLGFAQHVRMIDLKWIIELPQLRYLKVVCTAWMEDELSHCEVLPSEIRSTQTLETLEIAGFPVLSIPSDIVDLPRLSHLIISGCPDLPDGIGKVKSLRTLSCFTLPTGSPGIIKDLGELTNLEELDLTCTEEGILGCIPMTTTWMAAWSSSLQKLGNLRKLCVYSYPSTCCAAALSSWISPPFPMLEVLDVRGWTFSRIPRWMGDLFKLHTLRFGVKEVRNVSWDDIGIIGKLPCLIRLQLRIEGNVPAGGIVIGGTTGFVALQHFDLQIKSISYLKFEAGAMPQLQEMELKVDPNLCDKATTSIGLEHLSSLKEIKVLCQKPDGMPSVPKAVAAMFRAFSQMFREAVNALPTCPNFIATIIVPIRWTRNPVQALQMHQPHDADLDREDDTGRIFQIDVLSCHLKFQKLPDRGRVSESCADWISKQAADAMPDMENGHMRPVSLLRYSLPKYV